MNDLTETVYVDLSDVTTQNVIAFFRYFIFTCVGLTVLSVLLFVFSRIYLLIREESKFYPSRFLKQEQYTIGELLVLPFFLWVYLIYYGVPFFVFVGLAILDVVGRFCKKASFFISNFFSVVVIQRRKKISLRKD